MPRQTKRKRPPLAYALAEFEKSVAAYALIEQERKSQDADQGLVSLEVNQESEHQADTDQKPSDA
jgi:hypothetical protein